MKYFLEVQPWRASRSVQDAPEPRLAMQGQRTKSKSRLLHLQVENTRLQAEITRFQAKDARWQEESAR